jgi:hypothetical protein
MNETTSRLNRMILFLLFILLLLFIPGCIIPQPVEEVPVTHNEIVLDETLRELEYVDYEDNPIPYDTSFAIEAAAIVDGLELGEITVVSVARDDFSIGEQKLYDYIVVFHDQAGIVDYEMFVSRIGVVTFINNGESFVYAQPIS